MAAGKCIVSSPVGGIPELLRSAGCGFFSSDKADLIKHLQFLANSFEDRLADGLKGRKFVSENLTVERQAETLAQLYIEGLEVAQSTSIQ